MVFQPDSFPLVDLGAGTFVLLRPDWLRDTLREAARGAHIPECFADDVLSGIVSYFKNHYAGTTIGCADLISRIRRALTDVGLGMMAGHVSHRPPPVRIPLDELARQAGESYELGFFQLLQQRFRGAAGQGAQEVLCHGLKPCVRLLTGHGKWSARCGQLEDEIGRFLLTEANGGPAGVTITIH